MRAVAYTDIIQVAVLILGSALLTIFGRKLWAWDVLRSALSSDMLTSGMLRDGGHLGHQEEDMAGNTPILGWDALLRAIVGLWYWCNKYIVTLWAH